MFQSFFGLRAGALLFALVPAAFSQLVHLDGHITHATGSFAALLSAGDPINISIDVTPPITDGFNGHGMDVSVFSLPYKIAVGNHGLELPLPAGDDTLSVFLLQRPGSEGLHVASSWMVPRAGKVTPATYPFYTRDAFAIGAGTLRQDLLSLEHVLPSLSARGYNFLPLNKIY